MTLTEAAVNALVRVTDVSGGRKLVHRLSALGIVPGAVITVVRPRHPSLVSIGGARVAIGEDASINIHVEEVAT